MKNIIITLAAIGALALSGCGQRPEAKKAQKDQTEPVSTWAMSGGPRSGQAETEETEADPEDPTPGTQGRLTAEEEQTIAETAEWVVERVATSVPNVELQHPDQIAQLTSDYMAEALRGIVDVEDIKRRDAEATADGFSVDQATLPPWRRAD